MTMNTDESFHTASSVTRVTKGRVQELGRGSCSKNLLQSPQSTSWRVPQCSPGMHDEPSTNTLQLISSTAGVVKTEGPEASGAGQRHSEIQVAGLTKNQRRRLRRRQLKASLEEKGGFKRPLSLDSTPSCSGQHQDKKPRENVLGSEAQSGKLVQPHEDSQSGEGDLTKSLQSGSCTPATKPFKIAIVKRDFPSDKLSLEETDIILKEILRLTDVIPDGEWLPVILDNNLLRGALMLLCDIDTEEWVKSNFNEKILSNISLRVLNAEELPKPVKVAFKTKDRFSNQLTILQRLQRLNPRLNAMSWRVLGYSPWRKVSSWIFEVDPEDMEAIVRADYRALTGIDRGTFKVLHDSNKKKIQEEEFPNDVDMRQLAPEPEDKHNRLWKDPFFLEEY